MSSSYCSDIEQELTDPRVESPALAVDQRDDGEESDPSEEQIRTQLQRILRSETFVHCRSLSRFLQTVVEHTLAGTTDQIKECLLSFDVPGRSLSYDPRFDSIVRVQAHRLRARLWKYYAQASSPDKVLIELRRGSYIPVFSFMPHDVIPNDGLSLPRRDLRYATIVVLPMLNITAQAEVDVFCQRLTDEIQNALTSIPELTVRTTPLKGTSVPIKLDLRDVRDIGLRLGATTVLTGSVRAGLNHVRVSVEALDGATGLMLWVGTFDHRVDSASGVQAELSQSIAKAVYSIVASGAIHASAVGTSANGD